MRDLASRQRKYAVLRLLPLLAVVPLVAVRADEPTVEAGLWREGIGLIGTLWADARARLGSDGPDWLQHRSNDDPAPAAAGTTYLALQEARADGTDLLTVRYQIDATGPFRSYAGAGLSHAQYYFDDSAAGRALLSRQDRRTDLGPAAELGAELALGERVHIDASLRWADLDERASVLRGDVGPVPADPLAVGVTLGYRFR
jgi:opacity protein-like surface antigen